MRLGVLILLAFWVQLFVSLAPTWLHGEYYNYGWFVPPLAVFLGWRRWTLIAPPEQLRVSAPPRLSRIDTAGLFLFIIALLPLRLVEVSDPGWRPPLLLHALLVAGATHFLLARFWGARVSWKWLPITLFAFTAVPWPWQIEQAMVRRLTTGVIDFAHELFLLAGRPVEQIGERLAMGSEVVDVTDGCSGIRSLQSLFMVGLFFGELLLLSWPRRGLLLLAALAATLVFNTLRAYALADLHFTRGAAAAAAAHDNIGHLAFALSALCLWGSAVLLLRLTPRRRVIRRRV